MFSITRLDNNSNLISRRKTPSAFPERETVVYSQRPSCCWTPTQGDHKAVRQGRPTSRGSSPLVEGRFIKRRRMFVPAYAMPCVCVCVCKCLARCMTRLDVSLVCGAKPGASSAIKRPIVTHAHKHTHAHTLDCTSQHTHTHTLDCTSHRGMCNRVRVWPHKWWQSHCGSCCFHVSQSLFSTEEQPEASAPTWAFF